MQPHSEDQSGPGAATIPNPRVVPENPEGPPKTPWSVAALVVAIVIAFTGLFKIYDDSEFPETFWNPGYWLILGMLFLLAGVWAFFLAKKKGWINFVIVEGLFSAAALSLICSVYVGREASPSDTRYTVAVFDFSGVNDATRNWVTGFQSAIVDGLRDIQKSSSTEFLKLERPREIQRKGATPEERVTYARKWARRRNGAHLAVWGELHLDKNMRG